MTTHKKHYSHPANDFNSVTKTIAGTALKVVEINAVAGVSVAALSAVKLPP